MRPEPWLWGMWGVPYRERSRRLMLFAFALAPVLAVAALVAYGGWGAGGCGPVGPRVSAPVYYQPVYTAGSYQWVNGSDADQVHLYESGRQVGTYRYSTATYHAYDGRDWGPAANTPPAAAPPVPGLRVGKAPAPPAGCHCSTLCDCPADACKCKAAGEPPCRVGCTCGAAAAEQAPSPRQNHGCDWRADPGRGERWTLNGQDISRPEGIEALESGLPEDRNKLRLTALAKDPGLRKRLEADLKGPEFADCLVQVYDPSHWACSGVGLAARGEPTIYLQAPPDEKGKGKVLHRQDDYEGGAAGVAKALAAARPAGAVRKPDPSYDPTRDVDLRKRPLPLPLPIPLPVPLPNLPDLSGAWEWLVVAASLVLAWFGVKPKVEA